MNLAAFNKQLADFQKKVEEAALEKFKDAITTVADEVATRTPIDTSRAKSNWQASVGSPATSEVPFAAGSRGSTESQALATVRASAEQAAAQAKLGDKAFVTNRVPYIRQLNAGSSAQAAPNFVEHSVDVAKQKLK